MRSCESGRQIYLRVRQGVAEIVDVLAVGPHGDLYRAGEPARAPLPYPYTTPMWSSILPLDRAPQCMSSKAPALALGVGGFNGLPIQSRTGKLSLRSKATPGTGWTTTSMPGRRCSVESRWRKRPHASLGLSPPNSRSDVDRKQSVETSRLIPHTSTAAPVLRPVRAPHLPPPHPFPQNCVPSCSNRDKLEAPRTVRTIGYTSAPLQPRFCCETTTANA